MKFPPFVVASLGALAIVGLCQSDARAEECTINVARVLPQTGSLAVAAIPHPWIDQKKIDQVNAAGGLKVGRQRCKVVFRLYDSRSTITGAGEAITRAIVDDGVNIVLAAFAPETVLPVTDACERYEALCLTSILPAEIWAAPDGKARERKTSFHMFFSLGDLVKNHIGTIKALSGGFNGKVGYLYPNDSDGLGFYSLFDPAVKKEGWTPVDPGRFDGAKPDLSAIATVFKKADVQAIIGVVEPPTMVNFLKAAASANFSPKIYMIDKMTGYGEAVAATGVAGDGIAGDDYWSRAFPGTSRYGKYTAQDLIKEYEDAYPKNYASPPLGYADASWDVLFDAIERAGSVETAKLVSAMKTTDMDTVVGRVKFNAQHYSVEPIGTGQWRYDSATHRWRQEMVYNAVYPELRLNGTLTVYGAK